ncbi:hypothetical protein ES702_00339 [subsurface metagenome]
MKLKEAIKPKRVIRGIEFFDTQDIAKILNLSVLSARLYLRDGKIPGSIKINKRWYVSNRNLDNWLSQSIVLNKSQAEIIEAQVIKSIESNLDKIRIKQEVLKKYSAPKMAIEKLQKRIDEIEKNLSDYLKNPIKR